MAQSHAATGTLIDEEKLVAAWIIRSGKTGEREEWALTHSLAGGGFQELSDLTPTNTRDAVRAVVDADLNEHSQGARNVFTSQMWALRGRIEPGDLIVMPLKFGAKKIAFGICEGGYQYKHEASGTAARHMIRVDWRRTDIPRTAIRDDLLSTMNGAMTIFEASKNNAEARLRHIMDTGHDPGAFGVPSSAAPGSPSATTGIAPSTTTADGDVVDPSPAPTLEAIQDRVSQHISEHFAGHKFSYLIADILSVHGYVCDVSPPGADGGVDIWAGRGPLGLDGPTLVVECKSQASEVGSEVVRGLSGAISTTQADHGLLVAWGGLNKGGRKELAPNRHKIRLWEAQDVLVHLFHVYEDLPAETRARLPMTRAWVLDQDTD